MHREPRLARPPGAGERDEPLARTNETDELLDLALTPDQRPRLHGEIRRVQRPERRELLIPELEEPLRRRQIFEPMTSEVTDTDVDL